MPSVVIPLALLPRNGAILAMSNPLAGVDREISAWFHAHLNHAFVAVLRVFSEPGSSEWIAIVLAALVAFFVWKRAWPSLATLLVAVPGGMLLNELVKIAVHRHRPFVDGWFVDWSGYSFASGHTIGATLLYGQLLLFIVPTLKSKRRKRLAITLAATMVVLVGFSRIALGAHYLSDVLAAMIFGSAWLALCVLVVRSKRNASLPMPVAVEELVPVPVEVAAAVEVAPIAVATRKGS